MEWNKIRKSGRNTGGNPQDFCVSGSRAISEIIKEFLVAFRSVYEG